MRNTFLIYVPNSLNELRYWYRECDTVLTNTKTALESGHYTMAREVLRYILEKNLYCSEQTTEDDSVKYSAEEESYRECFNLLT